MCGVQILVTILNKYFLVEITSLQQQRRLQDNGQMKWGGRVILAFLCIFWLKKRNIKNADLVCSFSYWAGEPQIAPKNRQRSSSWHVFTNFPITNLRYVIFVLIFSNAQNWEKMPFLTNTICLFFQLRSTD